MSIDINWETITSGPDGEALAESIRSFIHDRFQHVTLPGFIRSVEVHSFDFGKICPQLEIKDIGDPLPDFYDDDDDERDDDDYGAADGQYASSAIDRDQQPGLLKQLRNTEHSFSHAASREVDTHAASPHGNVSNLRAFPPHLDLTLPSTRSPFNLPDHQLGSPFPRSGTPGIPGGTSNLNYFHLPLGGLSGTQTPLAAVASGTNFTPDGGWFDHPAQHHHATNPHPTHFERDSNPSTTRPSTAASLIIPHPATPVPDSGLAPPAVSPHLHTSTQIPHLMSLHQEADAQTQNAHPPPIHQNHPSDLQILTHVKYAGDIRLTLTAEILLDYPMPSFVGIPLKLSITGLTFDGLAVLASVRRNLHFCFLGQEDAEMVLGREGGGDDSNSEGEEAAAAEEEEEESKAKQMGKGNGREEKKKKTKKKKKTRKQGGGLLEEIKVESEIGRKEGGKQVLKNVGKVERFVLEQVRRIFEDEFVFPSFWTFLV